MSPDSPDPNQDVYRTSIICPNCAAFAQHTPIALFTKTNSANRQFVEFEGMRVRACVACHELTIWYRMQQIYPSTSNTAPPPNPDMPDLVKRDYNEARQIAELSPRGAGALLRVALHRLLQELAGHEGWIDELIHELEGNGMSRVVADMNHAIKVIGNNAVHPLELDLDEQPEMVAASFRLLNYIVDDQLTRPRLTAEMTAKLPRGAVDAIENRRARDAKKRADTGT